MIRITRTACYLMALLFAVFYASGCKSTSSDLSDVNKSTNENTEYEMDKSPEEPQINGTSDNNSKDTSIEGKEEPYREVTIPNGEIDESLLKKISYDIMVNKKSTNNFQREEKIIMGNPEDYSDIKGITTFRGGPFRDSPSFGTAKIEEKKLEIKWSIPIGRTDNWSGVGWNGQPSIVEWPNELKENMNINPNKKAEENLREVIYATLDGNVYFLDLDDGEYTREPIKIPGPVKGSVSVDPRGIPLLYVGQGINKVHGRTVEMGYRIFSLIDGKKLFFINGKDSFAKSGWPAFDSTALVDKNTDTLIICGENGILYTVKLNSKYDKENNNISIDPQVVKYRYSVKGNRYQGIENSAAVYRNLAFFGDNGGWLQCVDLNTLTPVWIQNVTDDTDSTIVLEEESEGKVALYTANEVDKQGSKGYCYARKLDALTGKILWEKPYKCSYNETNGGALATPVVGKKSIENMVIFNIARYGGMGKGILAALDKETGEEIWTLKLDRYCWSSPVAVYTENGDAYIIVCDSGGNMLLIEGTTGKVLYEISLGSNVEGSPAVFENMIVVGTRGQKIFGVEIK